MPDTDRDWKAWGRDDPYFGVLASPEFSRDRIGENKAAFFRTGEEFVRDALAELRTLDPSARQERALEHGCGTGRLTLPLSRVFSSVVALDISPDMLREAADNARDAGRDNIVFHLSDDHLSPATGQFDFVLSHLVLQHMPVKRGMTTIAALLDRVAPGGLFYISVSIRNDVGPWRWLYTASATVPGVKVVQNLMRGAKWNAPAMQMNHYPLERILAELSRRGAQRLSLAMDPPHPRFQTVSLMGMLPTR